MTETPEGDPREDLDAVREGDSGNGDVAEEAREEFEQDPSRNPDDENVDRYRGG